MTRIAATLALAAFMAAGPGAQKADPGIDKVLEQYQTAFNNADVKGLVALYTDDAMRLSLNNQVLSGRAAIEQFYNGTFAGGRPPALTIRPGRTQMISADVALQEGSYELADGSRGIYVNTVVRRDGQWRLASVVPVPDTR